MNEVKESEAAAMHGNRYGWLRQNSLLNQWGNRSAGLASMPPPNGLHICRQIKEISQRTKAYPRVEPPAQL